MLRLLPGSEATEDGERVLVVADEWEQVGHPACPNGITILPKYRTVRLPSASSAPLWIHERRWLDGLHRVIDVTLLGLVDDVRPDQPSYASVKEWSL